MHVNTLLAVLAGLSYLDAFNPFQVAVFIVSLSISHAASSFIPSVLLGAPADSSLLSVLPGHRLLLEGRALHAVFFSLTGCFFSFFASFLVAIPLVLFLLASKELLEELIPLLLFSLMGFVVLSEESDRKAVYSLSVSLAAGAFGLVTLRASFGFDSLFPALTGLFGVSSLSYALLKKHSLPTQSPFIPGLPAAPALLESVKACLAGSLLGFFPAIGSGQAAIAASKLMGVKGSENYLLLVGGIASSSAVFGLVALFFFSEAHSGAIAHLQSFSPNPSIEELAFLFLAMLFSLCLSVFLTLLLARKAVELMQNADYFYLNLSTLAFLLLVVVLATGVEGLLVCVTGALVGLTALLTETKRINLVAFLSTPTLLLRFGFS